MKVVVGLGLGLCSAFSLKTELTEYIQWRTREVFILFLPGAATTTAPHPGNKMMT